MTSAGGQLVFTELLYKNMLPMVRLQCRWTKTSSQPFNSDLGMLKFEIIVCMFHCTCASPGGGGGGGGDPLSRII